MVLHSTTLRMKASTCSSVPYHQPRGLSFDVAFTNCDSASLSTNRIHRSAQARYLSTTKSPKKLEYGPTRLHGFRRGLYGSLSPLRVPRAHILLPYDGNTSGLASNFPPFHSHSLYSALSMGGLWDGSDSFRGMGDSNSSAGSMLQAYGRGHKTSTSPRAGKLRASHLQRL